MGAALGAATPPKALPLPAHPPRSPGGGPPLPGDARPWHLLGAAPWSSPLQEGSLCLWPGLPAPTAAPHLELLAVPGEVAAQPLPTPCKPVVPGPRLWTRPQPPSIATARCPATSGSCRTLYPRPRTHRAPGDPGSDAGGWGALQVRPAHHTAVPRAVQAGRADPHQPPEHPNGEGVLF